MRVLLVVKIDTQECTLGWERTYFVHRYSLRLEKVVHIQPVWKERDAWGHIASLSDSSHGRSEIGVGNSVAKYAYVLNSPTLRIGLVRYGVKVVASRRRTCRNNAKLIQLVRRRWMWSAAPRSIAVRHSRVRPRLIGDGNNTKWLNASRIVREIFVFHFRRDTIDRPSVLLIRFRDYFVYAERTEACLIRFQVPNSLRF